MTVYLTDGTSISVPKTSIRTEIHTPHKHMIVLEGDLSEDIVDTLVVQEPIFDSVKIDDNIYSTAESNDCWHLYIPRSGDIFIYSGCSIYTEQMINLYSHDIPRLIDALF